MDTRELRAHIREFPNYPKQGVNFKDISPLLANHQSFRRAVHGIARGVCRMGASKILAIDARGFVLGTALAWKMRIPLLLARKKGKLPGATVFSKYALEYGTAVLEAQVDSVKAGERILIADDVLATGGTACAAAELVEKLGGKVVGFAFILELSFLHGRKALEGYDVFSLLSFDQ